LGQRTWPPICRFLPKIWGRGFGFVSPRAGWTGGMGVCQFSLWRQFLRNYSISMTPFQLDLHEMKRLQLIMNLSLNRLKSLLYQSLYLFFQFGAFKYSLSAPLKNLRCSVLVLQLSLRIIRLPCLYLEYRSIQRDSFRWVFLRWNLWVLLRW